MLASLALVVTGNVTWDVLAPTNRRPRLVTPFLAVLHSRHCEVHHGYEESGQDQKANAQGPEGSCPQEEDNGRQGRQVTN